MYPTVQNLLGWHDHRPGEAGKRVEREDTTINCRGSSLFLLAAGDDSPLCRLEERPARMPRGEVGQQKGSDENAA
jgi:hypothetical protein